MAAAEVIPQIDPVSLGAIITAIVAAAYAAFLKGKSQTQAVTDVTAAVTTGATPAVAVAVPTTDIFDPALHGGKGPNFWTWDQMQKMVAFKVSDATKKNMLDGIQTEKDRQDILKYIAAAEATNEYAYTIDYDHGYYVMHAVCSPIGVNEYKYQVLVVSSGMDKQ